MNTGENQWPSTPLEHILRVTCESRKRAPHMSQLLSHPSFPRSPQAGAHPPAPVYTGYEQFSGKTSDRVPICGPNFFISKGSQLCHTHTWNHGSGVLDRAWENETVGKPCPWEKHLDHDCCKVLKKITYLHDVCQLLTQLELMGQISSQTGYSSNQIFLH